MQVEKKSRVNAHVGVVGSSIHVCLCAHALCSVHSPVCSFVRVCFLTRFVARACAGTDVFSAVRSRFVECVHSPMRLSASVPMCGLWIVCLRVSVHMSVYTFAVEALQDKFYQDEFLSSADSTILRVCFSCAGNMLTCNPDNTEQFITVLSYLP